MFMAASLAFVIAAQFLNALIVLVDKHIVTRTAISSPAVYSFYVGILSAVFLVLAPFGVVGTPDAYTLILSAVMGAAFIASILFLYHALKIAATTDVVPLLAALSTITAFTLGTVLLDETLPRSFLPALGLFVAGTLLVGHFRFNARSFLYVILSAILFGFSAILLKILFAHTSFLDGLFWSRMGNVAAALTLLAVPACRRGIRESSKRIAPRDSALVIVNRFLGGVAFLFTVYAIHLGSVSLVNALSALQFLFVFLIIFLLRRPMPEQFTHEFRPGHVAHKVASMICIFAGFLMLFL